MKTSNVFRIPVTALLTLGLCLGLAVPAAAAPNRGDIQITQVIAPQYENARNFSEGLAAVQKDGKWGYIDETGKVVINFQYDYAWEFNEGYAVVAMEEYSLDNGACQADFGFVDRTGRYTALQSGYSSFSFDGDANWNNSLGAQFFQFHNGVLNIANCSFTTSGKVINANADADDKGYYISTSGPLNEGLIPGSLELFGDGGRYSAIFLDVNGNVVKKMPYNSSDRNAKFVYLTSSFNQGLAAAWEYYPDTDTYLCGFIDRNYNWVIQPQYTEFFYMDITSNQKIFGTTGLASVKNQNGKWGAIDKTGKTVIPFQYDYLTSVQSGRLGYCLNGKFGYLDAETYQPVIPAQYVRVSEFNNELGLAAVYDGQKTCLIDHNGTVVPGTENLDTKTYFPTDDLVNDLLPYMVIQENGKYGFAKLEYTPSLPAQSEMSSWAYEEVTAAIEAELVPVSLQNLYRSNISREEFCDLVLQAVSEMAGKDVAALVQQHSGKSLSSLLHTYPFQDASGENVVAANALGIINGRGNRTFDPYSKITRQEAAVMLMRAAKLLGMDTASAPSAGFADSASIGSVYQDGVNFVYSIDVMGGVGNNQFGPKGNYTREQSFMTVYRLFQALEAEQ